MGGATHHDESTEKSGPLPQPYQATADTLIPITPNGMEKLEQKQTNRSDMEEPEYPPKAKVIPIVAALYAAFFLLALVRPPAPYVHESMLMLSIGPYNHRHRIPRITDDSNSLGDVGWYGSAYMLTGCAFQLIMGRVYTFYNLKKVFL